MADQLTDRLCIACHKPLVRKQRESELDFENRQTCCRECYFAACKLGKINNRMRDDAGAYCPTEEEIYGRLVHETNTRRSLAAMETDALFSVPRTQKPDRPQRRF